MWRRLNDRNQITLPPDTVESVGASKGDFFEISVDAGRIILKPKQMENKDYPETNWSGFQLYVREQEALGKYKEYKGPKAAKQHLRKLKK